MRFVYHCPETTGTDRDLLDIGSLPDVAGAVERAGFHGFSLSEHPVPSARWLASGGHQSLDPLVALGHVAAVTRRLRLHTNLVVAPYRNPFLLAKAAATLDLLSNGRLVLGLGAGYLKSEFHALGVDVHERGALFDEVLDVLPLHWSGEPFSYRGRHFDARDVVARPRPVQRPVPVWIGGNSRAARRRVAERAQGWMPLIGPPALSDTVGTDAIGSLAELAGLIAGVRAAAKAAGRSDEIDVQYSYRDPSLASPSRDADRHREALAEIGRAGVTTVVVSSPAATTPAATQEFIEAFGATYLK